jgi:transposase-like protein
MPPDEEYNLHTLTRQHVEATIREHGIERAWKLLGISRRTLYEWRKRWREEDRRAAAEAKRAEGE